MHLRDFMKMKNWAVIGDVDNPLKYAYQIRNELKEKGYTSYKLRKDKIMGEAQIQKIRNGEIASKETLNTICKLLQCQPGDILEYIEDITE